MDKRLLEPYVGKQIKLVLKGTTREGREGFILRGIILAIDEPHISFKTKQKTSVIHFDRIMEITPM